ncbi:MAG: hypothetical protein AAFY65_00665 [Pseudomonadota bacterium]
MKHFLLSATLLMAGSGSAWADQVLGSYYAYIGADDFYNSRGTRLTDPCAILQQDRANYHRFGIWHDGDQSDPFFDNRAARTVISQDCRAFPSSGYVADSLRRGEIKYVYVQVHGRAGRVTYVMFGEGAG